MASAFRIALLDGAHANCAALRNLILTIDWVWLEGECSRYEFFPDLVEQCRPDGVVVSLDADPTKALQLIEYLNQNDAGVAIMAVSSRPERLLQAHRHGARSLSDQPVEFEECQRQLKTLRAGHQGGPNPARGHVTALLGSRGGVGCTSLAVNPGSTLAEDPQRSTVLASRRR